MNEANETEDDDDEQEVPRRSTRAQKKQEYLSEYIFLTELECEQLLIMINLET